MVPFVQRLRLCRRVPIHSNLFWLIFSSDDCGVCRLRAILHRHILRHHTRPRHQNGARQAARRAPPRWLPVQPSAYAWSSSLPSLSIMPSHLLRSEWAMCRGHCCNRLVQSMLIKRNWLRSRQSVQNPSQTNSMNHLKVIIFMHVDS